VQGFPPLTKTGAFSNIGMIPKKEQHIDFKKWLSEAPERRKQC